MSNKSQTNDTMNTDYYLEPSNPEYRGEGIPATMQVWVHRVNQPPGLAMEPVLLYPDGYGSSPGGNLVSPIAMLAEHASMAARRYHRGRVGGWTRPQPVGCRGLDANA